MDGDVAGTGVVVQWWRHSGNPWWSFTLLTSPSLIGLGFWMVGTVAAVNLLTELAVPTSSL